MTKKDVAKAGVFNISGYTPIQSVERANLYDVLTFISAEKAENDLLIKANESTTGGTNK